MCVCGCPCVHVWVQISAFVCIVHLPERACPCSCVFVSEPLAALPPPGWQGSEGPAPRVILNTPLISFVCSSVRERSARDLGCWGLTFTLNLLTPPLPSPLLRQFICKQPVTHLFFSFICPRPARLLCQVSSSSPWTGRAIQGRARPQQTWEAGEGGGSQCLAAHSLPGVSERRSASVSGMGWGHVLGSAISDKHDNLLLG